MGFSRRGVRWGRAEEVWDGVETEGVEAEEVWDGVETEGVWDGVEQKRCEMG